MEINDRIQIERHRDLNLQHLMNKDEREGEEVMMNFDE
jgi:hypothetical protein